jgi:hypothetical protein
MDLDVGMVFQVILLEEFEDTNSKMNTVYQGGEVDEGNEGLTASDIRVKLNSVGAAIC